MNTRNVSKLVARRVPRARAGASAMSADKSRRTIKDLQSKPSGGPQGQRRSPPRRRKAMENYKRFLELQKTDPQLRAEAMRRLGDLNLESGEIDRMATEVTADGPAGRRSHQAVLDAAEGLSAAIRATTRCSTSSRARTRRRASRKRRSRHSTRIVRQYPQSPQLDEVQFRRGELLFSAQAVSAGPGRVQRRHQARLFVGVLRAEPLQARLVAVQAVR